MTSPRVITTNCGMIQNMLTELGSVAVKTWYAWKRMHRRVRYKETPKQTILNPPYP